LPSEARSWFKAGPPSLALNSNAKRRWTPSFACNHERRMVDQNIASWNQVHEWLSRLDAVRHAARSRRGHSLCALGSWIADACARRNGRSAGLGSIGDLSAVERSRKTRGLRAAAWTKHFSWSARSILMKCDMTRNVIPLGREIHRRLLWRSARQRRVISANAVSQTRDPSQS